jgi:hypothetical protein
LGEYSIFVLVPYCLLCPVNAEFIEMQPTSLVFSSHPSHPLLTKSAAKINFEIELIFIRFSSSFSVYFISPQDCSLELLFHFPLIGENPTTTTRSLISSAEAKIEHLNLLRGLIHTSIQFPILKISLLNSSTDLFIYFTKLSSPLNKQASKHVCRCRMSERYARNGELFLLYLLCCHEPTPHNK